MGGTDRFPANAVASPNRDDDHKKSPFPPENKSKNTGRKIILIFSPLTPPATPPGTRTPHDRPLPHDTHTLASAATEPTAPRAPPNAAQEKGEESEKTTEEEKQMKKKAKREKGNRRRAAQPVFHTKKHESTLKHEREEDVITTHHESASAGGRTPEEDPNVSEPRVGAPV